MNYPKQYNSSLVSVAGVLGWSFSLFTLFAVVIIDGLLQFIFHQSMHIEKSFPIVTWLWVTSFWVWVTSFWLWQPWRIAKITGPERLQFPRIILAAFAIACIVLGLVEAHFKQLSVTLTLTGATSTHSYFSDTPLFSIILISFIAFVKYFLLSYYSHTSNVGAMIEGSKQHEEYFDSDLLATPNSSQDTTQLFFSAVFEPERYIRRLSETIHVYAKSRKIESKFSISLDGNSNLSKTGVIFPLVLNDRGKIQDGFEVRARGKVADVLSFNLAAGLIERAIDERVKALGNKAFACYRCRPEGKQSIRDEVASLLFSREAPDVKREFVNHIKLLISILKLEKSANKKSLDPETSLYEIVKAIRLLWTQHPIPVLIPGDTINPSGEAKIARLEMDQRVIQPVRKVGWKSAWFAISSIQQATSLEKLEMHRNLATNSWRDYISDFVVGVWSFWRNLRRQVVNLSFGFLHSLRSLVGIQPSTIRHSLANASRTRSYHLEIQGPEGSYITRQKVEAAAGLGTTVRLKDFKLLANSTPSLGQRHAHLYVANRYQGKRDANLKSEANGRDENRERNTQIDDRYRREHLGKNALKSHDYLASFLERRPGRVTLALVVSISALLVIVFVAYRSLYLNQTDTSLVILLLGFPLVPIVGGILLPGKAVWGGSAFVTFAELISVGLVVAGAVLVSHPKNLNDEELLNLRLNWDWLIEIALVTTIICAGSSLMRSMTHSKFEEYSESGKKVDDQPPLQVPSRLGSYPTEKSKEVGNLLDRLRNRVVNIEAMASAGFAWHRIAQGGVATFSASYSRREFRFNQKIVKVEDMNAAELRVCLSLGLISFLELGPRARQTYEEEFSWKLDRGIALTLLEKLATELEGSRDKSS